MTPNDTLFTIPCEAVFNTHPHVARTALVGIGAPGAARPVICVEAKGNALPIPWVQLEKGLRSLGAAHEHTRMITAFLLYKGSFPVDIRHNAKIFREKLGTWAARQLA